MLKKAAAQAALEYIVPHLSADMILGIGTGSTVNYFIEALSAYKHDFDGVISSSIQSKQRLIASGIPVYDLNTVDQLLYYIDGADEINSHLHMIKGGGAALTGEKIISAVSKSFICIADVSKKVDQLGAFPVPVEVIPMARSYVAREIVKLGGNPEYRQGVYTDYGNIILDIWNLDISNPLMLEEKINQITGVVMNGLFSKKGADILFLSDQKEVKKIELS